MQDLYHQQYFPVPQSKANMHLPAGQRAFDSLMLETFLRVQAHTGGVEAESGNSGIRWGPGFGVESFFLIAV